MPALRALQHLYSSVERGHRPDHGRGFQTVAVSPELAGTEDLKLLERASFYAVRSRDGAPPVKEVYFRLPSGRVAVGRTVDWGIDSLGREGNYLTHHLVLEAAAFREAGADAFAVLDAAELAAPGTDLTPRELPALQVEVAARLPVAPPPGSAQAQPAHALGIVTSQQSHRGATLLIAEAAATRAWLRAIVAALTPEERETLTFCTHFYESGKLRDLFRIAAVRGRDELPADTKELFLLDLAAEELVMPVDIFSFSLQYAHWFAEMVAEGQWEEAVVFNDALATLRRGGRLESVSALLPKARAALWEKELDGVLRSLRGNATLTTAFLSDLVARRVVVAKLLTTSPATLCGPKSSPEASLACLMALREAAPKEWKRWLAEWRREPLVQPFLGDLEPLWTKIRRRLPKRLGGV